MPLQGVSFLKQKCALIFDSKHGSKRGSDVAIEVFPARIHEETYKRNVREAG